MSKQKKSREIIQSYELRIQVLEAKYISIIEGKDKLIEKYESDIEYYRRFIEQLNNRKVIIKNGNYNEEINGDYNEEN